jgi:pyruvate/2-oxoglutarate dehydrogenase complex dihydrolipoamide acyltransferase (E2) component
MQPRSPSLRLLTAVFLGLASIGACGAAMPEQGAEQADELARKKAESEPKAPNEPTRCPHGALEDPHRGFVRCLRPEERDAGWLPPAPQPEPEAPDGGADAAPPPETKPEPKPEPPKPEPPKAEAPKPEPEKPGPPPLVTVAAPKFEGGEVPRAEKFVNGLLEGIGKCIAENGGLKGSKGKLELSFLVRVRGRAEGVEIGNTKGIGDEAAACIQKLVKNKPVGAPTSDPVGVSVTFTLERPKP